MIPFNYENPDSFVAAASAIDHSQSQAIAGGTTMVDLMKLNVLTPQTVVDIGRVLASDVVKADNAIQIGAGCTMAELADHELIKQSYPVIRQSLILAASPQIRNMATIGGNLLQRTRSPYFRHTDMPAEISEAVHSKSEQSFDDSLGSGADTSLMAVLGNGGRMVSLYPGDFAVAFVAFGGTIHLDGPEGKRSIPADEFYKVPGNQFQYQTALKPHELIASISLPITPSLSNSYYFKIRERSSYAFALVSVAAGLEMDDGTIKRCHIGLGGLGSIPWHAVAAEQSLIGKSPTSPNFAAAADAALADAQPPIGLEYKIPLAKRAIVRTLTTLVESGPLSDEQLWQMQHGR